MLFYLGRSVTEAVTLCNRNHANSRPTNKAKTWQSIWFYLRNILSLVREGERGTMSFNKKTSDYNTQQTETTPTPAIVPSSGGSSKLEAFLGKNTRIVGRLSFTGAVELDGFVEGEVETNERLIIGESANVNAKVNGTEIIIKGTVSGDVAASKRLSLHKTAKVFGNITCSNISVEEGAIFEGHCTMPTASQNATELKVVGQRQGGDRGTFTIK
jgi:cytoskeletal protein CcmA (bactofilin family)